MTEDTPERAAVDRFILDHIDSVPHLEGLLLLWRERSKPWTAEDVSKRLWIKREEARRHPAGFGARAPRGRDSR